MASGMSKKNKKWIDESSLETLLWHWRFAPSDAPMLQGATGEYFAKRLFGMKDADPEAWTAASKRIGW